MYKIAKIIKLEKFLASRDSGIFFMIIIIAFDVGRTLPNTDLSRDFMELVVDRWVGGSWRGG